MDLTDIRTLYDYNGWSRDLLLSAVEAITGEQFLQELGGSHGSICNTLNHIMGAEEIWLKRLKGEPSPTFRKPEEFFSLQDLAACWREVGSNLMSYINSLKSDQELLKDISYSDLKGNRHTQPLYQILQHLVNHSTDHRGQVTAMLRQLGVKPANTDMIAFYREIAKQ